MQPLISVIIPVYNVEKYLAQCLDSVIGQTYGNLEVICVNDGSPDNSLAILNDYAAKDARIKIISKQNGGLSSARNAGLLHATGKFISFIDSDDYVELNLYERVLEYFNDDIDVVSFEYTERYEDNSSKRFIHNYSGEKSIDDDMLKNTAHTTWNKIYRKECIDKFSTRFPEGYIYEDIVFFWNLFPSSIKNIYFINESLYNYRIQNTSIMGNTYSKKSNTSIYHIFILDKIYEFWSEHNLLANREGVFIWLCHRLFPLAAKHSPDWEVARCCWEMTTRLRKWNLPLEQGTFLQRLRDGEYHIDLVDELNPAPQKRKLKGFEHIFCVRNEGNHKIVRLFGVKIASKRRKKAL